MSVFSVRIICDWTNCVAEVHLGKRDVLPKGWTSELDSPTEGRHLCPKHKDTLFIDSDNNR